MKANKWQMRENIGVMLKGELITLNEIILEQCND